MNGIASIYVTFPDEVEARRIGRQLIEERLAACVNIVGPCHSIYRWNGKIEEAGEVAAIFKIASDQADAFIERLNALHSYDVPAVVLWPIEATSDDYRDWVLQNCSR